MLLEKIDKYYETNSMIHKINPFIKILCFIIFIIIITSNDLMINLILVDLLVILIFLSRVPLSIYLEMVIRLRFILLLIFIINIICGITIVTSLVVVIKTILIIWYLSLLTLTTSQIEIASGLELLLRPLGLFKIKVNKLALDISFALRFIPMLFNQMALVLKAMASRGLNYQKDIMSRVIIYPKAIIPVVTLTIAKINQMKANMEIRLFNINRKRTNYRTNNVGIFDIIVLIAHIGLLILMIRLRGKL